MTSATSSSPSTEWDDRLGEAAAERGERMIHPWRHLLIVGALYEPTSMDAPTAEVAALLHDSISTTERARLRSGVLNFRF